MLSNHKIELSKPSSRSLLKPIKSTVKTANLILRIRVARRWLHVDFLKKITIEKCIFHIYLKQRPITNRSNSKQGSNKGKTYNKSKSLLIINVIFLSESLGN